MPELSGSIRTTTQWIASLGSCPDSRATAMAAPAARFAR